MVAPANKTLAKTVQNHVKPRRSRPRIVNFHVYSSSASRGRNCAKPADPRRGAWNGSANRCRLARGLLLCQH